MEKNYINIRLRPSVFNAGGIFYGQNPSDVIYSVSGMTNSNQGMASKYSMLRIGINPIRMSKQQFAQLGISLRLELSELNETGIIYVMYNNTDLSTFEIANYNYDIITKVTGIQDLTVAALSLATRIPVGFVLDKVMISFSGNVTQTVQTVYVVSDGTEFVLDSQALVAVSVYTYMADVNVDELDQIKVTCTDAGGVETATAMIFIKRRWDGQ